MADCPSCTTRLVKSITPNGVLYGCPSCGGRAVALTVVRKAGASEESVRRIWTASGLPDAVHARRCPHCGRQMAQAHVQTPEGQMTLDVCRMCAVIWFDRSEFARLPKAPPPKDMEPLPLHVRQQAAMLKAQAVLQREESVSTSPEESWHWIPGLLGLPVECDAPGLRHLPWATWLTGLACSVVSFLVLFSSPDECRTLLERYGFVPSRWNEMGGVTLLTSFFLHGGFIHLASNMYFLVVFGDNVEDRMGKWRFVVMLLAAHLAGVILHGAIDPRSDLPLVGASAGISGVIAYYAISFPKVRLAFLFWRWSWIRWVRMSAVTALVLFVLLQFIGAALQLGGFSNVSALGHLGGLAVGVAAGVWTHLSNRQNRIAALGKAGQTFR